MELQRKRGRSTRGKGNETETETAKANMDNEPAATVCLIFVRVGSLGFCSLCSWQGQLLLHRFQHCLPAFFLLPLCDKSRHVGGGAGMAGGGLPEHMSSMMVGPQLARLPAAHRSPKRYLRDNRYNMVHFFCLAPP